MLDLDGNATLGRTEFQEVYCTLTLFVNLLQVILNVYATSLPLAVKIM
jgi:hypothetical protein